MGPAGYIIIGIILALCVFITVRRIKKIKKGQYCSCGCENCPSKTNCIEKD